MGSTVDEALAHAGEALADRVKMLEEEGKAVPDPGAVEELDLEPGEMVAYVNLVEKPMVPVKAAAGRGRKDESLRMWPDQLERVERYYRRCEVIKREATEDSIEDDNDTIYAFFQNCHHLMDWLNLDSEYRHRAPRSQRCENPKCAGCYLNKNAQR